MRKTCIKRKKTTTKTRMNSQREKEEQILYT